MYLIIYLEDAGVTYGSWVADNDTPLGYFFDNVNVSMNHFIIVKKGCSIWPYFEPNTILKYYGQEDECKNISFHDNGVHHIILTCCHFKLSSPSDTIYYLNHNIYFNTSRSISHYSAYFSGQCLGSGIYFASVPLISLYPIGYRYRIEGTSSTHFRWINYGEELPYFVMKVKERNCSLHLSFYINEENYPTLDMSHPEYVSTHHKTFISDCLKILKRARPV